MESERNGAAGTYFLIGFSRSSGKTPDCEASVVVWLVGIAAALLLWWMYPRQIVLLGGFVVFGIAAVSVYHVYVDQARKAALKDVAVVARYDAGGRCSASQPIAIEITNSGSRTLEAVTFDLVGRRPGHNRELYADVIDGGSLVEQGGTWAGCRSLHNDRFNSGTDPSDAPDLIWSAVLTGADFR